MSAPDYVMELKGITDRFGAEVLQLASKYRAEVVVPACRKHNLSFMSGMGVWFFTKGHDASRTSYSNTQSAAFAQLSKAAQATLAPIFGVLASKVSSSHELGDYVDDFEWKATGSTCKSISKVRPARRRATRAPSDDRSRRTREG